MPGRYSAAGAAARRGQHPGRFRSDLRLSDRLYWPQELGRSVAFYRDGLGWPTEGIVGQEFCAEVTGADRTIAFFALGGGLLLGLYERTNLAKDAGLPTGPSSSTEFSLGIPATSRAEVDQLLTQVEAASCALGPASACCTV